MKIQIQEVDKIEILTLQDNYIDLLSLQDTEIISRAKPIKGNEVSNSILAEHGFSLLVTVTMEGKKRSLLYDFGFSSHGALYNAKALNLDLRSVESLALSHGHLDHFGGIESLTGHIGKKGIEMVLHPAAFKSPRYFKLSEDFKINLPTLSRELLKSAGINIVETRKPYALLDGCIFSTGEIPRRNDFEKGVPYLYSIENGIEKQDPIEDDMALIINVKGKGLVILTGCAHAGIVNTVNYAKEITGEEKFYVVMGGFHLTGPDFEPIISLVTGALKTMNPKYIVPTHCTGRKAIMYMEKEMPEQFILNMSGTLLTFSV